MGERKIHNRHRSCFTKKAYETEGEAEDVKDWLLKEKGAEVGVYYCNSCNAYHLTSLEKKRRR